MNKKILYIFLFLSFLSLLNISEAAGLTNTTGYLDNISNMFTNKFKEMGDKFQDAAKVFFFSLAVISLTWTFGQIALKGGEISSLMFEVMRATLVVGFFWWLITDAPNVLFVLFNKFAEWGSGVTSFKASSASQVVDRGQQVFMIFFDQEIEWGVFDGGPLVGIVTWLIGLMLGVFAFVTSVFIAINLILYLIEFYFLCYVGIFILGVAGASWTRDIAISYVKKLIAVSISYFSLTILCSVIVSIVGDIIEKLNLTLGTSSDWLSFFIGNNSTILKSYFTIFVVYLLASKAMSSIPNAISNFFGQGAVGGYNPTLAAGAMAGAAGYGGMKLAGMGIKGGAQKASHAITEGAKAFANHNPNGAKIATQVGKMAAGASGGAVGLAAMAAMKMGSKLGKMFGGK